MATDTIRRYRIHPCIAVWCGANEEAPPPDTDAGLAALVMRMLEKDPRRRSRHFFQPIRYRPGSRWILAIALCM